MNPPLRPLYNVKAIEIAVYWEQIWSRIKPSLLEFASYTYLFCQLRVAIFVTVNLIHNKNSGNYFVFVSTKDLRIVRREVYMYMCVSVLWMTKSKIRLIFYIFAASIFLQTAAKIHEKYVRNPKNRQKWQAVQNPRLVLMH